MNFKHVPSCVFVTFHPRKTSHCGHDFRVKYAFLLLNGVSISKISYKWNANYHKGCSSETQTEGLKLFVREESLMKKKKEMPF